MTALAEPRLDRVPLGRSQQNIYNGALQADDPALYLIGKSYRFQSLEVPDFLAALGAVLAAHPIQLCVLEVPPGASGSPELVRRLQFDDIVKVVPDAVAGRSGDELVRLWSPRLEAKPLVRYTVRTGAGGTVSGLDIHAHHLLLDGGAVAVIEADLARRLATGSECHSGAEYLGKIATAHSLESAKSDESQRRHGAAIRRELNDAAQPAPSGGVQRPGAARGVLRESVTVSGKAFDEILALSQDHQVPLNILVAAASIAVDASIRQSTAILLIHAVDNRFGDPALDVATCLVNSIAHPVRFPVFASVEDVVRALDRDYVKAARRRWFREEQYRRMYVATHKTSHIDALTFNFIREVCAPALRPFLSEVPVATDIGPVEGMTVACVVDDDDRTLTLAIWDRADTTAGDAHPWIAERIAAALGFMKAMWHRPIAMIVNEWFGIGTDGACRRGDQPGLADPMPAPAWFLDPASDVESFLRGRPLVHPWIAWLTAEGVALGDIVVCVDDNTDKTVDLLIACHLAGCGYSVCEHADDTRARADSIAAQGTQVRVIDIAAARLATGLSDQQRRLVQQRLAAVTGDGALATRTAYIMPTSGSTGHPKLVPVSHGSLAVFCAAARGAYGWNANDTVLQCAPLTSDISVEEIFVSATCGTTIVRSAAVKTGDLDALCRDIADGPTLIDLPTALWHLLCEDPSALDAFRTGTVRQVIVGGESIRPSAVKKWIDSAASHRISLISTYGPTETAVVATQLPVTRERPEDPAERLRLGMPMVPDAVFVAFGEVVIVGDTVSPGYLGVESESFGTVSFTDGRRRPVFATADRVTLDESGFPVIAGRRDAIVKISGKRVDTAEALRVISADAAVTDVGVGVHDGALAVWFQTVRTREGLEDHEVATGIRRALVGLGVSSFVVVGVPRIPRRPNGKIDNDSLRALPQFLDAVSHDTEAQGAAARLARIWSRQLRRDIRAESSLLDEGIGSLDLIKILPDTRRYLGRALSVLDLISADSAAYLVAAGAAADALAAADTAAEIGADFERLVGRQELIPGNEVSTRADGPIVVLGASGIVGSGFAGREVVLVTRSRLRDDPPRVALKNLLRETGAGTLVNCIGNTNMLAPYRDIRDANVEWVSAAAQACAEAGVRLAHMSTYVVNDDETAAQVTDPRYAVYPYAASKALAELVIVGAPKELDFTIVRLPRVLGDADRLKASADVLVSIVDACIALRACPAVALTEEVTTGADAAASLLAMLGQPSELGRGLTVVRGTKVAYTEFLDGYGLDEIELPEWKRRLDLSDWAVRNPRRWSVLDAWAGLGMRIGSRTYADFLAEYPTVSLGAVPVREILATPRSIRDLLVLGIT